MMTNTGKGVRRQESGWPGLTDAEDLRGVSERRREGQGDRPRSR